MMLPAEVSACIGNVCLVLVWTPERKGRYETFLDATVAGQKSYSILWRTYLQKLRLDLACDAVEKPARAQRALSARLAKISNRCRDSLDLCGVVE